VSLLYYNSRPIQTLNYDVCPSRNSEKVTEKQGLFSKLNTQTEKLRFRKMPETSPGALTVDMASGDIPVPHGGRMRCTSDPASGGDPGQGGDGREEDPMDIPVQVLAKRFKISVCLWEPMHLVSLYYTLVMT